VTVDNIEYDYAPETFYVNNWETVDVLDGGVFQGALIFQITESASSWTLGYEWLLSDYHIIWSID
jgi:hypothetical protein